MNAGDPGESGAERPGPSHESFLAWLFGLSLGFLLPVFLSAQVPYQAGWPVEVDACTGTPIYIADIDDNGDKELVSMIAGNNYQNAMLYVFEHDGSVRTGFPKPYGLIFAGNPALADLDDNGTLEIIVAQDGDLFYLDNEGAEIVHIPYDGPVFQSKYWPYQVSVDDLDNDGIKEIIVTCYSGGGVFVFDKEGNVLPGWPVFIPPIQDNWAPPGSHKSASLGDIDLDGDFEIMVGTFQGHFYCFHHDGSICSGFPYLSSDYDAFNGQSILYDVDNNGDLEIIVGNGEENTLHVFNHDGSELPPYPLFGWYSNGYALGDINNDGLMELVYNAYHSWVIDLITADVLPGWPVNKVTGWGYAHDQNLICDIDGDSRKESIFGAYSAALVNDGRVYAFHHDGTSVPGFPTPDLIQRGIFDTGVVDDIDQDGDVELCFSSTNYAFYVPRPSTIFCWDIDHPYNLDNIDWAMDGFDLGHTGRWRKLYHIDKTGSTLSVAGCATDPCYLPADGSLHAVNVTAQRAYAPESPSGQDVRYSRTPGCGEYSGPVIDHGDGTYTRTLQAPSVECSTEVHAWVNEFKLNDSVTIHFTNCNDPANLGDVDLDGDIDYTDKQLVQNFVDGLIELSGPEFCRGDVNGDFSISATDTALLNNCIRARCDQLPEPFRTSCRNHGNCFLGDLPRGFPYDRIDRDLPSFP